MIIQGKTPDGFWRSQQFEEYTPLLSDKVAHVCSSPTVRGLPPAPQPPFSSTPRTPTAPPYRVQREAAHASLQSEIEDALIAYDGPATDLLDLDPTRLFTAELECNETSVDAPP